MREKGGAEENRVGFVVCCCLGVGSKNQQQNLNATRTSSFYYSLQNRPLHDEEAQPPNGREKRMHQLEVRVKTPFTVLYSTVYRAVGRGTWEQCDNRGLCSSCSTTVQYQKEMIKLSKNPTSTSTNLLFDKPTYRCR